MGINRTTIVLVGIPIDVDQYFDGHEVVPSRFPDAFLQAAEAKLAGLDYGDFEKAITDPRALESVLGNLPNGLCFLSNDGEGCEDPQYFLAKHIGSTGRYYADDMNIAMSEAKFKEHKQFVEHRAVQYGFEGEAILAIVDRWG